MKRLAFLLLLNISILLTGREQGGFFFADSNMGVPGDSFYTRELAIRFRSLAHQLIPRTGENEPKELLCTFSIMAKDEKKDPYVKKAFGKRYMEIFLPAVFSEWSENPAALNSLARWTLYFRMGIPLEKQELFPDSWVEAGMSRKALSENSRIRNVRFGKFPAAYAQASHGIFPGIRDIISVTPKPSDGFYRLVYEEWAQILLDICIRSGAVKKGLLEKYLRMHIYEPQDDPYLLFINVFYDHLKQYGSRKYGRFVQSQGQFDLEKWFRREAERMLVSRFLPMSLSYLEESFHVAMKLNAPNGIRSIEEFAEKHRGRPDAETALQISESLIRLSELLYSAPSEVTLSLSALIEEITFLRDSGADESSAARLAAAGKNFFQALEKQSLIENILKDAERRYITPGARCSLTFSGYPWIMGITNPAQDALEDFERKMEEQNERQGNRTGK